MIIISKILFFLSHHGFYAVLIFILFFGIIAFLTKKGWWLILILPFSIINGIGGQFINAWFLNKFGVESTAIITSDIETNSTLNDQYIHDYEAIVKKQDGKYVDTYFSTTSAAIYPIENAIRIPRTEQQFPVKYIPGYEKNIVILYHQSNEGKQFEEYEKMRPIHTARIKYEADPTNQEFKNEYISSLENYLKEYDNPEYKAKLQELQSQKK
jgi:energy-coupling factor transporter transmembrane protein EcfT